MTTKLITVLCEGPHDVAFINRVLKTKGFKSEEAIKLKEYPKPMNELFIQEIKKTNIEELNFTEVKR